MTVQRLAVHDLPLLTQLFDYHDVPQMLSENARDVLSGAVDIFVLREGDELTGELHVRYDDADERYAARGRRAYLFAFRVREDRQGRGHGTRLMREVLARLQAAGYREFTVGVEDDNARALHMYRAQGFTQPLLRRREEYQGDAYEYTLYLKK